MFDTQPPAQWSDRYGHDGYVLLGWNEDRSDRAKLPTYVERYDGGDRVNLDTRELDISETPLLYGLPFTPLLGHLWFLGADVVAVVFPDRPDLLERALASPPWRWWGLTVQPPHPEHGMGPRSVAGAALRPFRLAPAGAGDRRRRRAPAVGRTHRWHGPLADLAPARYRRSSGGPRTHRA